MKPFELRDPNDRDGGGNTLLIASIGYGWYDLAKELIVKPGINLNAQNNEGDTALILAVISNREDIVKLLLDNGAKPHLYNNEGKTAFHYAVRNNNYKIAEMVGKPNSHYIDENKPKGGNKPWKFG